MKALVTGGGGFLGTVISRFLMEKGFQVCSLARCNYPVLTKLGVEQVKGDIADPDSIIKAADGCEIIFHVAAKAGIWGSYDDFYQANVTGTKNVINACKMHGIIKLVYTSSPSVVFDGSDIENGNESLPYPEHYEAFYPQTKAIAEQLVLDANSAALATVSLRPHLIWGPGDNHLVPRIIAKGKNGRLRRIGNRPCLVDTVYVDNAALAHLQAAEKLEPGNSVAGKAYFISNGEPLPLWDMINRILAAANLPPVKRNISPEAAYTAGAICEKIWKIFRLRGEPPMTRFVAREMATSHWFDLTAARADLGYHPQVTIDEGLKRLNVWFNSNI